MMEKLTSDFMKVGSAKESRDSLSLRAEMIPVTLGYHFNHHDTCDTGRRVLTKHLGTSVRSEPAQNHKQCGDGSRL